ncbi:MAG: prolipoprotein diacylglyceryl transferase [Alphaproteobacteria bacterium]
MTGLEFPNISPILFSIGPLAIRWYSLAYLFGILIGWFLLLKNIKKYDLKITPKDVEELIFYYTLGVILGGRLGYVLFYGTDVFIKNPLQIFAIWQGGMSFHGGILGVIIATYLYAKKFGFKFLYVTDLISLYVPIGIFLGRIANFINDELWGRETTVPWAVRFPSGGYIPRHPSQLYEAFFEGLIMFIVLQTLWRFKKIREHTGFVSAIFVISYGVFRFCMEYFRQPDVQLGFLWGGFTMGQFLSVPFIIIGLWVIFKKNAKQQ